jgi:uncharacterized protein (TIGR03546 family)
MAFLTALIPFSLLWILVFLLAFLVLKINHAVYFVFLGIFSPLGNLFFGLTDPLGQWVLGIDALSSFFTAVKNTPFLAFLSLDYSVVTGSLVLGLLAFAPLCAATMGLVIVYRKTIREKIASFPLVKAVKNVPLLKSLFEALGKAWSLYSKISA